MIENFAIINEKGELVEVNFDDLGNISLSFEKRSKIIYESKVRGIRWINNNIPVQLFNESYIIEGLPTTNKTHIIVLYHVIRDGNPSPVDAEILNANGTIHKTLKLPKLISNIANKYYNRIQYPDTMFFSSILRKKVDLEILYVAKIGFNRDWYEERILDIETGEFGVCVGSGRR